jgi:mannose-6-phosphate isomerase-like protein (cupin superfamily)
MTDYTLINLRDLENMSVKYGHDKDMEARFATKPLKLEKSGVGLQKVLPGRSIPFKHRHAVQEEVFIFVEGSGRMLLDDKAVEVKAWDAVRVPAEVIRQVEAGPDGLEVIIIGAPHTDTNDIEIIRD